MLRFQCWASLWDTFLGIIISQPLLKLLRVSLVSEYLGLDAILRPDSFLHLYKAQIRPCLEYGSHLWREPSKHSLATLDAIQKRAVKLIGDPTLRLTTHWAANRDCWRLRLRGFTSALLA